MAPHQYPSLNFPKSEIKLPAVVVRPRPAEASEEGRAREDGKRKPWTRIFPYAWGLYLFLLATYATTPEALRNTWLPGKKHRCGDAPEAGVVLPRCHKS